MTSYVAIIHTSIFNSSSNLDSKFFSYRQSSSKCEGKTKFQFHTTFLVAISKSNDRSSKMFSKIPSLILLIVVIFKSKREQRKYPEKQNLR